ncbi:MAG: hypothetical protein M3326_05355 [Actinomycetota bacterium]|nr:hypothetical protein [Actinomycetota bacterium]
MGSDPDELPPGELARAPFPDSSCAGATAAGFDAICDDPDRRITGRRRGCRPRNRFAGERLNEVLLALRRTVRASSAARTASGGYRPEVGVGACGGITALGHW